MAVTLAPDELRDAEITDGIGRGDVGCAARLWVRYWPTALGAARRYVDPEEVPGLAAEALIGTITAVAIGRGPREDVAGFVADAVRELGEDDEPFEASESELPEVFVSAAMTEAFAALEEETQQALWAFAHGDLSSSDSTRTLTVLQHYYLADHADRAQSSACRRAHIALMGIADGSAREGLPGETWLHLSTCAWCTEAFHETAFSNVALGALIAPAVLEAAAPRSEHIVPVAGPAAVAGAAEVGSLGAEEAEPAYAEDGEDAAAFGTWFGEESADAPYAVEVYDADPYADHDDPADTDDDRAGVVPPAERSRRRRVVAGVIVSAAAVAVAAMVVAGLGSGGDAEPTAAGTRATGSPSADVPTEAPVTPALTATGSATVAPPLKSPTTAAAGITPLTEQPTTPAAKPSSTPTPRSSPKPSSKPSAKPTPSSTPTSAPPPSTPTASPTKRCNGLQHLLGIC